MWMTRGKSLALMLISTIFLSAVFTFAPVLVKAAAQTQVRVVNPRTGNSSFNFNTSTTSVGYVFLVNITVVNVTDLATWQIKLSWNASFLSFVNISLPADHVFAASGKSMITPPPTLEPGNVTWGCTYINYPYWTFNGTGRLCQAALNITGKVDASMPEANSTLALTDAWSNTFLWNGASIDISFVTFDGYYDYKWISPSFHPTLYIQPLTIEPTALYQVFPVEVWVRDVAAGWSIVAFNFSLMWNTTFISPAAGPSGGFFDNGTFLEGFQYHSGGVQYSASVNMHDRPPPLTPLPTDCNYSKFSVKLLPDNPPDAQYHEPFANGSGRLMTVYFQAVYETISPVEDWTTIEFVRFNVNEDTYAVDMYGQVVGVSSEQCSYRAPVLVVAPGVHDLAVAGLVSSKSIIGQGYVANVTVTVQNEGNFTETFDVALYANTTLVGMVYDVTLAIENSTSIVFIWDTTRFAMGNYTMNANVTQVANETDIADNSLADGFVWVGVPSDITGTTPKVPDGVCNMRDIGYIANQFGKTPSSPGWDPNADLTGPVPRTPDGKIDMRDIGEACNDFG